MALSYSDAGAELMEHLCSHSAHGYSQVNRQGVGTGATAFEGVTLSDGTRVTIAQGDRDCSSAVIECYAALGVDVGGATYTGNMRQCMTGTGNFRWHPMSEGYPARRGDIYLNEAHHTAMCLHGYYEAGGDTLGQFSISENGTTHGTRGDQTGYESNVKAYYDYPWDGKLEYVGPERAGADAPSEPVVVPPTQATGGVDLGHDLTMWGPKFTRELERQLGTTVDGFVSGQSAEDRPYFWAVEDGTVEYDGGTGSLVVGALQRGLIAAGYSCGTRGADGCYGRSTIAAHQRWLSDHGYSVGSSGADGYHGRDTNRAMATALADGAYSGL